MDDDDETTYETAMFLCFILKIHLYLWLLANETKSPQHLDCGRSLRLMGDKTIPNSEPRLESFNLPYVAGIDLPRQGVVDSYIPSSNFHWLPSVTGIILQSSFLLLLLLMQLLRVVMLMKMMMTMTMVMTMMMMMMLMVVVVVVVVVVMVMVMMMMITTTTVFMVALIVMVVMMLES